MELYLLIPILITFASVQCAEKYKVLILGAGAAGITAGKELHDKGVTNFLILEGGDTIGGRVQVKQFGGRTINIGAAWIHGKGNNPIYKLALKYGLKLEDYDYDDWVVRNTKGEDVTDLADTFYEQYATALDKVKEKAAKKRREYEPDVSVRSALQDAGWIVTDPVADICEWFDFDYEWGVAPERQPIKIAALTTNEDMYPGVDTLVTDPRGYIYILERLLAEYSTSNNDKVRLKQVVSKIEYTNHPDREHVKVTTKTGEVYEADYAIITFSLGVFQRKVVEYSPPLPSWKMDVLNNMAMSYFLPITIKFPQGTQPFWDDKLNIVYAHPRRGYYTSWRNTNKFYPGKENTLVCTVIANEAIYAARTDKASVVKDLNEVLSSMYGSKAVPIEDIFIPDWIDNPLFYGMFSSITFGMTNKTFQAIPAPVGPLFFAGEHTTLEQFGFIQGAYLTGIRAADDIIKCEENHYCQSTFYVPHKRPGFY